MSRDFSSGNYLTQADNADNSPTPTVTMAAWVFPDTSPFASFVIDKWGASNAYVLYLDGGTLRAGFAGSRFPNGGAVSTGVWTHIAASGGASGSWCYNNGVKGGNGFSTTVPDTGDALQIGPSFDGRIAHAAIWSGYLSDDDHVALARGFSPMLVKPDQLLGYWPIYGNDSPEPDLVNGRSMTVTGSPAKSDARPPIIMPREAIYLP
jgi:hypothetical protein